MKTVLLLLTLVLAIFHVSQAQQPTKPRRIGLLMPGASPPPASPTPFDKGLRQLGYVEGQNIAIERRYASGQMNRLPELAADLVRLFVDVILRARSRQLSLLRKQQRPFPSSFLGRAIPWLRTRRELC